MSFLCLHILVEFEVMHIYEAVALALKEKLKLLV